MESSPDVLTSESRFFLEPASSAQRQYEALRAYFVEGVSSADVSRRFGYTPGSFRVLCHHFRRSKPDFFRELKHGPHTQPKKNAVRELILGMRKQNLSIYDYFFDSRQGQPFTRFEALTPNLLEGFGNTSGFEFILQDRTGGSLDKLGGTAYGLIGALMQRKEIAYAFTTFNTGNPQYMLNINEAKTKQLGVKVSDLLQTLQVYYGSSFASDFNRFGKYYRVIVQADIPYRADPTGMTRRKGDRRASPGLSPASDARTPACPRETIRSRRRGCRSWRPCGRNRPSARRPSGRDH